MHILKYIQLHLWCIKYMICQILVYIYINVYIHVYKYIYICNMHMWKFPNIKEWGQHHFIYFKRNFHHQASFFGKNHIFCMHAMVCMYMYVYVGMYVSWECTYGQIQEYIHIHSRVHWTILMCLPNLKKIVKYTANNCKQVIGALSQMFTSFWMIILAQAQQHIIFRSIFILNL